MEIHLKSPEKIFFYFYFAKINNSLIHEKVFKFHAHLKNLKIFVVYIGVDPKSNF